MIRHLANILVITLFIFSISLTQNFDENNIKTTVLIEKKVDDKYYPYGTGVLIDSESDYLYYVITCKHLLNLDSVYVSINVANDYKQYSIEMIQKGFYNELDGSFWERVESRMRTKTWLNLYGEKRYIAHPTYDVGIFAISIPDKLELPTLSGGTRKVEIMPFAPADILVSSSDIKIGKGVYFIGFPFGLGVYDNINPIVRFGTVAWKDNKSEVFMLDAFSYGGNSGSPIYTSVPDGQKSQLIGIIFGHHGVQNENYGLALAINIKVINEFAKDFKYRQANGYKLKNIIKKIIK